MISIRSDWLASIFLFVTVTASSALVFYQQIQDNKNMGYTPNTSDGFMKNVVATEMDDEGAIHSIMTSPKVVHFPERDRSEIDSPDMTLFNKRGNPWHLHARFGQSLYAVDTVYLWDHVNLVQQRPGEGSDIHFTTEQMTVYPRRSFAQTDKPVVFTQYQDKMTATGMRADFKENSSKFLSQVHSVYHEVKQEKDTHVS